MTKTRVRSRLWSITPLVLCAVCVATLSGSSAQAHGQATTQKATTATTATSLAGAADGSVAVSWPDATSIATRATQKLTLALLQENTDAAGNAVISPYSIEQALAQLALGARGQTATQIARALGARSVDQLDASTSSLGNYLGQTTSRANVKIEPQLSNANSIWLQSNLAVNASYLRDADSTFGMLVKRIDFASGSEAARATINQWVSKQTHQHIQQLFPAGSITSDTLLALVNALYLNARWATPFDRAATAPASFRTASGATTRPEFMSLDEPQTFELARTSTYTAVDLPYTGGNLSMLLVMPHGSTLAQFEAGLTTPRLAGLAKQLKARTAWLRVPRFKLALNVALNSQLMKLGITDAFSQTAANFSGITSKSMSVGTVQHAATLDVFEGGTVASAATGTTMVGSSAPSGAVPTISFNRPFLALIRDRLTGAILFAAAVGDPTTN